MFRQILLALGLSFAFRLINEARVPGEYVLNTILPEVGNSSYQAKSGTMTVFATMAGLAGKDSPYPETGFVEVRDFTEETAKIAGRIRLPETALREIQAIVQSARNNSLNSGAGSPTALAAGNQSLTETVLNFTNLVLLQSHLDSMEWLRGQALSKGEIDWTFNKKRLKVDYGLPAANKVARTGNNGYGGSTSKFWEDLRTAKRKLGILRAVIMHPDTYDMIISNSVNNIEVLSDNDNGIAELTRLVGNAERRTTDARDRLRLLRYGLEGSIIDPADNTKLKNLPFVAPGKIIYVGQTNARGFRLAVGAGSQQRPNTGLELGYTHISPTVEGNGQIGRWGEVYTPENEPYALEGRAVTNGLPVIESIEKLFIAETDMV